MTRADHEAGNAVLEFVILGVLFLVPLVYIMLAVLRVQGSAYGVTEATREAGRAFVSAASSSEAYQRACTAATVALQNQSDVDFDCATELQITCMSDDGCAPALTPGDTVRVEINLSVGLPMLPTSVFGRPVAVGLHSAHDEMVDVFRAPR